MIMKNIKIFLLTGICIFNIYSYSQTNNTTNRVPVNSDPTATPPVQNVPTPPQNGVPPTNKVILRSKVDSMYSTKRAASASPQNVYPDSSRMLIHQGDTETIPKRK